MDDILQSQGLRVRYELADLVVDLGRHELRRGDAVITLPGLSFDLLVALVRAAPNLVTYDELMKSVWPGLVVGQETITQRVKLVRDALGDDARGPRYIEAVRGKGYRIRADVRALSVTADVTPKIDIDGMDAVVARVTELAAETTTHRAEHAIPPPQKGLDDRGEGAERVSGSPWRSWRPGSWLIVASILIPITLLVTAYWLSEIRIAREGRGSDSQQATAPSRVAVLPFEPMGTDERSTVFAATLADAIAGSLSENLVQTIPLERSKEFMGQGRSSALTAIGATFALGGTVRRARDNLVVRAYLEDVPSGVYVWSLKFERPADAESLLLSEIAAATTDIVHALASSFEQPGLRLDPQTLSIFLKAAELLASVTGTNDLQAMTLLEQAIARAPAWADAHATLALALTEQIPREDFPDRLARAREEARTAIALYSGSGAGYDALFRLARFETPTNLLAAEAHLLEGLDNAPTFPPLHMRHCDFLLYVGRISEALSSCERAAALRPLFAPSSVRRALALWFGGQNELALRVMEATWAQHPRQVRVSVYRFFMLAFDGPVRDAATALTQVEPQAMVFPPPVVDAFEKYFVALESGTNDDIDAALQAATEATKPNPLGSLIPIVMAAKLGRVDDAVEMFVRLEPSHLTGTSLLFSPGLKPVHRDPRFMSVMARSGHIQYWRETRKWPDFCEDPTLPYKCESEAEAVLPQT